MFCGFVFFLRVIRGLIYSWVVVLFVFVVFVFVVVVLVSFGYWLFMFGMLFVGRGFGVSVLFFRIIGFYLVIFEFLRKRGLGLGVFVGDF